MKVVWSAEASAQLENIFEFLAKGSEIYAHRTVQKLVARADDLGDFPEMGRVDRHLDDPLIRELLVSPYIVRYFLLNLKPF